MSETAVDMEEEDVYPVALDDTVIDIEDTESDISIDDIFEIVNDDADGPLQISDTSTASFSSSVTESSGGDSEPELPRQPFEIEMPLPQLPILPTLPQLPIMPTLPQLPIMPMMPQLPIMPMMPQLPVMPQPPIPPSLSQPPIPLLPQPPIPRSSQPPIPRSSQPPIPLSFPQPPIPPPLLQLATFTFGPAPTIDASAAQPHAAPVPPGGQGQTTLTAARADDTSGETGAAAQAEVPSGSLSTSTSVLNESVSEFQTAKRRKRSSPEKKETAKADVESDDDGDCCPICFDPWTTSGSHRLSSLRCGHLFGQSCIEKWLRGQGGKCPHCNAKAKRQDVRVLFAKAIKAVDTTERDRALSDLEKEKDCRRKAEMEAAHSRLQYQLCVDECYRLRQDLHSSRSQLQLMRSQMSSDQSVPDRLSQAGGATAYVANTSGKRFAIERTVKIWEGGQCRVLAYSSSLATIIISQPSSSALFPGFGIKKLSSVDFKTSQYLTIHSKAIRDVCFHPLQDDGILLSGGMDKTARMTSVLSNTIVQTYHTEAPVWSCAWNWDDRNYFYTGLVNGSVLEYDIRNTQTFVQKLNTEGSKSPVVALQYIPRNHTSSFRPGGIVVGQLDRISFFEKRGEERPKLNFLPIEGSLTSLSFDSHTSHLLASFRPNVKHSTVRHQLCEMTCTNMSADPSVSDNMCSCNIVHTFQGGKTQTVLAKTALVPSPSEINGLVVCTGDESSNSLVLWDCSSGNQIQRISIGAMAVDLTTFSINGDYFLVALTEKVLKILKWC